MLYINFLWLMLKDELLGLAADPSGDPVFKNHSLNMDVLYRTGETQQVELYDVEIVFTYKLKLVVDFVLVCWY